MGMNTYVVCRRNCGMKPAHDRKLLYVTKEGAPFKTAAKTCTACGYLLKHNTSYVAHQWEKSHLNTVRFYSRTYTHRKKKKKKKSRPWSHSLSLRKVQHQRDTRNIHKTSHSCAVIKPKALADAGTRALRIKQRACVTDKKRFADPNTAKTNTRNKKVQKYRKKR